MANLLIKPGKLELCEIKTPKPSQGEILVKIKAALTCGTDLKAFLRGHSLIPMPGVFGHEFSGIVKEVGRGVRRFKEGDAVMAVHTAPCLTCMFCEKGKYNLCEKIMNTKALGAFAEYILLPPHVVRQNVFHKPENLPFEEAAFLEPLSCVVHSVDPLDFKKGNSALIIGAGPIGLLHLLLLKRRKVRVAVADIRKEKLEIAKRLGADFEIHPNNLLPPFGKGGQGGILTRDIGGSLKKKRREDYQVKEFTDGIGFDYVFECTGRPEVWETSVNYVRKGGMVILFGGCESGTTVTYDTGRIHYAEITLKGVFHYTPSDVKKAYKLLCERRLGVSRLISDRYPLTHTQEVFDKLSKGEGIKYAIIP